MGLRACQLEGAAGVRELLLRLRCIQLDPIDRIGTNADLVALARVDGIKKGDVYRHLLPGHAFEHFAKERCLLPAHMFSLYRQRAVQTPWWRLTERLQRLDPEVIERVYEEVRRRGPIAAADLADHGRVEPLDWDGWTGTARAGSMALEVLWTRCRIVVCGRTSRGKLYDLPERALPGWGPGRPRASSAESVADPRERSGALVPWPESGEFERLALLDRVEAAGLLCRAGGPQWSMLGQARTSGLVEQLVAEGAIEEVRVEGSDRPYLAPAGFLERTWPDDDGRMRILGPLDPLLWDRKLVQQCFDFEYVWEVYKPVEQRRWGWYVCPLLHDGQLVGRVEAHTEDGRLVVDRLWKERLFDGVAWRSARARHRRALC